MMKIKRKIKLGGRRQKFTYARVEEKNKQFMKEETKTVTGIVPKKNGPIAFMSLYRN